MRNIGSKMNSFINKHDAKIVFLSRKSNCQFFFKFYLRCLSSFKQNIF